MSIPQKISDSIDLFGKVLTPLGIVAILFLNTQYVTRKEYVEGAEKLSGRVQKIEEVLIRMEANYETDKRHDNQLADHETRLRVIEAKTHL